MTITRQLMGPGAWHVRWRSIGTGADARPAIPQSILAALKAGKTGWSVAVGPKGLLQAATADADRLAILKEAGGYRGVYLRDLDPFTIGGTDLLWHLGTSDGIGPMLDAGYFGSGSTSLSTLLNQILPVNGISTGTVTAAGSVTDPVIEPYTVRLHALEQIVAECDAEYIVQPDGTLDAGPSTTLFPAPSASAAVVIMDRAAGKEGGLVGLEAVDLARTSDATSIATRAVVARGRYGNSYVFSTASAIPGGVEWRDDDGNVPTARSIGAVASGVGSSAGTALATRIVAKQSLDDREVLLTSRTFDLSRAGAVKPGSRVYVFDLGEGLYDTSVQLQFAGGLMFPTQARIGEITEPVSADKGVFLRQSNGAVWYDVTDFVEPETGDVQFVVSRHGRLRRSAIASSTVVVAGPTGRRQGGGSALSEPSAQSRTSAQIGGWTPSWNNVTVGTGGSASNTGQWAVADGEMRIQARFVLGAVGPAIGGVIGLNLPSGWQLNMLAAAPTALGVCRFVCAGAEQHGVWEYDGVTNTRLRLRYWPTSQTIAATGAAAPRVWAAGDSANCDLVIPVAKT